jgi:hypothetical protein
VTDLVASLTDATGYPWGWHVSRHDAAVLFFGRPIPEGTRTISSHAIVVFGEPGDWHTDVLRYAGNRQALRVPASMTWEQLLDFVTQLVPRLGGVSPLYQPVHE